MPLTEQATRTKSGKTAEGPIGHRLRMRRKDLGLTLKDVAAGAGLSVGFISQVERGLTAPSLSSLASIAKVLKTDTSTYFRQPSAESNYTIRAQRTPYTLDNGQIEYERVSSGMPGLNIRSVIMRMPPGYRSEDISHDGEEMVFVLSGEVTSHLDGRHRILHAGDSVHYKSTTLHSLWNHTQETTTALWVGTQDLFGEDPPGEDPA